LHIQRIQSIAYSPPKFARRRLINCITFFVSSANRSSRYRLLRRSLVIARKWRKIQLEDQAKFSITVFPQVNIIALHSR